MSHPSPGLPGERLARTPPSPGPLSSPGSGNLASSGPGPLLRHGSVAVLSEPLLRLRRLHYLLDLLSAGYRQALRPDATSRSLRAERIALGIDIPELDTVPLWATRRPDGSISIPFVEFILDQICRNLDDIIEAPALGGIAAKRPLQEARRVIGDVLSETVPEGEEVPLLPRLTDVYMPALVLERLCGAGGVSDEVIAQCTEILAEMSARRD